MIPDSYHNRLLVNRYQILESIGKGAMGQVHKASDKLLGGVTVAVKFLSQPLNKKIRDRFEREATICALLGERTIHIVRVRDYGIDENEMPFYVMEYLQGEGLKEIIRRHPLSLPRFISLTRQICLGLQCAHQGIIIEGINRPIIHRDIKPSNILIIQDTSFGELAKILDFGIAKIQSDATDSKSFMGTLAYSSPEQIEGKELDNRSDIYSLGIMMFEMLTGKMPLMAEKHSFRDWYNIHHYTAPKSFNAVSTRVKLPQEVEDLVMSCLAKSPSDRPQNVAAILQTLESLEERFGKNVEFSQAPAQTLSRLPVPLRTNQQITDSLDEISRLTSWPKDKPQAEIVFPHILHSGHEKLATLWVMLSKQDIQNRQLTTRYNHFLFVTSPHPMILWITALHNWQHGPRWLPCYLDLKTSLAHKIIQIMIKSGSYRLLFFALEEPDRCANIMPFKIASAQCQMLQDWLIASQKLVSVAEPGVSKKLLKQELERLKPKILRKLEARSIESDLSEIN